MATLRGQLLSGQSLLPGDRLVAVNGNFFLQLQPDQNLVLYTKDNQPLWSSETMGTGAIRLDMQTDGNLVLYNARGEPNWATNTNGKPGAKLAMQDDGNAVLYHGTAPLWSTDTWGGVAHTSKSWLQKAADATLHAPSNLAKSVVKEIKKAAPDVAKGFRKITQSSAWKIAAGAAVFIPGAGVAVSAAMASATVIGKAASAKDALIGVAREQVSELGPLAQTGFDAANGVLLQGKPVTQEVMNLARDQAGKLSPEALAGFDAAASLHVGRYSRVKAPVTMKDPKARAAFYTAQGLRNAPAPLAKRVHASLGIAKDPVMKKGFHVGVSAAKKEHQIEAAQVTLAKMRETMRQVREDDPRAVAYVRELVARDAKADAKAKAELKMLAIADRANREIAGHLSDPSLVRVAGVPVWLNSASGYLAALATIPYNWLREIFFEDDAAEAA